MQKIRESCKFYLLAAVDILLLADGIMASKLVCYVYGVVAVGEEHRDSCFSCGLT